MSAFSVCRLDRDNRREWALLLERAENATLFSEPDYLSHIPNIHWLGVFERETLVAGFAVPTVTANGRPRVGRASYIAPYFHPVFARVPGSALKRKRRRRKLLGALLDFIQSDYEAMVLPLHLSLDDMVPFQQRHFALELRYTYILALSSLAADGLPPQADGKLRNHRKHALHDGVSVQPTTPGNFDFAAALFYENPEEVPRWRALTEELHAADRVDLLVAVHQGRTVGGLLLANGAGTAYNLLSYFDRDLGLRGIAVTLLTAAMEIARRRGLHYFDFEGSVLPGIERFFESFGGRQVPYFQAHWHRDAHCFAPIRYHYE